MNEDTIKGNWKQLKGSAQKTWGKITDDKFDEIEGDRKKLVGQIQEDYGIAKDEAEKQVKKWEETCDKAA